MQMGAYVIAAEGMSLQAMLRATKAYLQRRVTRDNHTFAPSAAEYADQCRYQDMMINHERSPRIARALEPETQFSEEHREKMKGLFKTLQQALAGDKRAQKSLEHRGWKP